MPIPVTCPGCKTSFTVGDQHAGKKGPCPKCKAIIAIPKLPAAAETRSPAPTGKPPGSKPAAPQSSKQAGSAGGKESGAAPSGAKPASPPAGGKAAEKPAPAPMPEVKIHEPEASGPKGATGRPVSKPITRKEAKIALVPALIAAAGALVTLAVAWIAREPLQAKTWAAVGLRGLGLALISAPLVAGGYTFLRDDELEPYRGRWLWFRSFICAAIYIALWGGYYLIPADFTKEPWIWIFIGIPFFSIGAGAALATLDLDYTNGFFHYCFYVLVTLSLGWIVGLPMPWASVVG